MGGSTGLRGDGGLLGAGCSDDGGGAATESAPTSRAVSEVAGILDRDGQITAWTDEGLFVYGGVDETRESVGGAALIDPDTGVITALPEPFAVPIRRVGEAVLTESGVLLMGELCQRTVYEEEDVVYCEPGGLVASVLSLADHTWRPVDLPDDLQAGPRATWLVDLLGVAPSGALILELAPEGSRDIGDAPFWSFQPESAEWTRLADPGVEYDDVGLASEHLVVSASQPSARGGTHSNVTLHTLPVEPPGASWEALPPLSDVTWGSNPLVTCGGAFAVVYGFTLDAPTDVAFSQSVQPPGEWEDLSPFPDIVVDHEVWTGDQLVLFGETGEALALDDGTWTRPDLPRGPIGARPVWTGEEFVVIDPASDTGVSTGQIEG